MKELSSGRKNVIIKAGFKPLRWAFSKNDIEIDPTRGQMLFSLCCKEGKRAILPLKIAAAIYMDFAYHSLCAAEIFLKSIRQA